MTSLEHLKMSYW